MIVDNARASSYRQLVQLKPRGPFTFLIRCTSTFKFATHTHILLILSRACPTYLLHLSCHPNHSFPLVHHGLLFIVINLGVHLLQEISLSAAFLIGEGSPNHQLRKVNIASKVWEVRDQVLRSKMQAKEDWAWGCRLHLQGNAG